MKKEISVFAIVFGLLAMAGIVSALTYTTYSVTPTINMSGNCSYANYSSEYLGVAQVNSSIRSNQETYYKSKFNLTINNNISCTVTQLNYTLEESWAVNSSAKFELLNSTGDLIAAANTTSGGTTYPIARFQIDTLTTLSNDTDDTYYLRWHLTDLDNNKSTSTSVTNINYKENTTYWGPPVVALENVTLVYKPTKWTDLDKIKQVQYNGNTLTSSDYSQDATNGLEYEVDLTNGTTNWFYVDYTVTQSAHEGSGGGMGPVSVLPTTGAIPLNVWLLAIITVIIIVVMAFGILIYTGKIG